MEREAGLTQRRRFISWLNTLRQEQDSSHQLGMKWNCVCSLMNATCLYPEGRQAGILRIKTWIYAKGLEKDDVAAPCWETNAQFCRINLSSFRFVAFANWWISRTLFSTAFFCIYTYSYSTSGCLLMVPRNCRSAALFMWKVFEFIHKWIKRLFPEWD